MGWQRIGQAGLPIAIAAGKQGLDKKWMGVNARGWVAAAGATEQSGNERADERLMACCLPASPNLEHSKSFLDARINFRFRPGARPDLRWTGGHLSGMLYKHTSARSAFKSLDKE